MRGFNNESAFIKVGLKATHAQQVQHTSSTLFFSFVLGRMAIAVIRNAEPNVGLTNTASKIVANISLPTL